MGKSLIIYGSEYGSSEKYAKALAEKLGIDAVTYQQFKAVEPLQTLIYIGSLYAGGVKGMASTLKKNTARFLSKLADCKRRFV